MEYYTSWPHKHTGTQAIFTQNREKNMKKKHICIVYSTYVYRNATKPIKRIKKNDEKTALKQYLKE